MLPRHLLEVSFARAKRILDNAKRRRRPCTSRGTTRRSCLCVEQLEVRLVLSFNPTGLEQELLQLVNRFRTDPQGELTRLVDRLHPISSPERYVMEELQFWGVRGLALAQQWKSLVPVPPLAWSESLYHSAHVHNAAMIQHDDQQHQFPGEADPGQRMRDEGYIWRRWGENIYAYPHTNLEAHAGFVLDWGSGPNGIQDPPDHRNRLLNASFQHIGIAVTNVGDDSADRVGPLVVTQDLGQPLVATDAYVVGAVFEQMDGSPWYRRDRGYGQVTITMEGTGGTFQTSSLSAGGYQVQLPPGTYRGFATGGELPEMLVSDEFVIGAANVVMDFRYPQDQAALPIARADIVATNLATGIVIDVVANDEAIGDFTDAASVTISTWPAHGSLTPSGEGDGTFLYEPASGFRGVDAFEYQLTDSLAAQSNMATVRVLVFDFYDHPWHNRWVPPDVNGDDFVSPIDVLLVIDDLNAVGARELPVPPTSAMVPPLLDVSGDDLVTPRDALLIISQLNSAGSGQAEGEAGRTPHVPSSIHDAAMPVTTGGILSRLAPREWSPSIVDVAFADAARRAPAAACRRRLAASAAEDWLGISLPTGLPEDVPPTATTRLQKHAEIAREALFPWWPASREIWWP